MATIAIGRKLVLRDVPQRGVVDMCHEELGKGRIEALEEGRV